MLKWKGYRTATWEPRANLDGCDDLLELYEQRAAKRIISEYQVFYRSILFNLEILKQFSHFFTDVRKINQRIEYLVEQNDDVPPTIVAAPEAFERWPKMVFKYLEQNVHFDSSPNSMQNNIVEANDLDLMGSPIKISCE